MTIEELKALVAQCGWTVRRFADMIGVPETTVRRGDVPEAAEAALRARAAFVSAEPWDAHPDRKPAKLPDFDDSLRLCGLTRRGFAKLAGLHPGAVHRRDFAPAYLARLQAIARFSIANPIPVVDAGRASAARARRSQSSHLIAAP